ncbi:MAG: host-nuclease inhibitor Gam family protein [Pseudomonadota bacterium]
MQIRKPRSVPEAQRLLERFAKCDAEIAAIEEARDVAISAANAQVDRDLAPLLKERTAIVVKLEPWWAEAAAGLTKGKRKTIELGGCIIGTREGKASLQVIGKAANLAQRLAELDWANDLVRTTVSLDKPAVMKALEGEDKAALEALGLSRVAGEVTFFVKRTLQGGTQPKVS